MTVPILYSPPRLEETYWPHVEREVNLNWDIINNTHHLIVGSTGSGKSHLGINGILKPMCAFDRVLIVDTKGDDPTTSVVGKPVRELPRNTWYKGMWRKEQPFDNWYRLVTYDGHMQNSKAREQVGQTIIRCVKEGNWIIFLDEAGEICESGVPNLGLGKVVGWGLKKGRYHRVPFISATQAPVWIPRWLIDQSTFVWGGYIRDPRRQKLVADVLGMSDRESQKHVMNLSKREWILSADPLDLFYKTMVTRG